MFALSIPYTILRSHRKTIALEVTREGTAQVRAPYGVEEAVIHRFVREKEPWLQAHLDRRRAWLAAHPEPSPQEMDALRRRAREVIPPLVAHYGEIMGLSPAAITITGARTRFGSCSSRGRLSFSWRLMTFPPEAVTYVVVHELAHMLHPNHSPAFYACVASILPDWKQRQALLRP